MRLTLAIALSVFISTACFAGSRVSPKFLRDYAITLKQVMDADKEMSVQIKVAVRKLEQFYMVNGRLPSTDTERALFQNVLGKYVVANPYHPQTTDLMGSVTESEPITTQPKSQFGANNDHPEKPPYKVPIFWLFEENLDEQKLEKLIKKPDPSWQADPGTIVVLSNRADTFLVWAASADRQPMRDLTVEGFPYRMTARIIRGIKDKHVIVHKVGEQTSTSVTGKTQALNQRAENFSGY